MTTYQQRHPRSLSLALLAILGCALLSLLAPLDYRYFSVAARAWLNGSSRLYDAGAPQFFYAPWSLALLIPLAPLPDRVGQAVLNLISLLSMIWSVQTFAKPLSLRTQALALISPYLASILVLGQWDGLIMGGIALGWHAITRRQPWLLGLALVIITTKPTNALLPLLLLLWAIRRWGLRDSMRVALIPLVALSGSLLACGLDWPLRYLHLLQVVPQLNYQDALWQLPLGWLVFLPMSLGLAWLGWSVYRHDVSDRTLMLALLVNLMVSHYVVPYHYVNTLPALAFVGQHRWWWGVVLWLLSVAAFLAYVLQRFGPLLVLYLLVLFAGFVVVQRTETRT